MPLAKLDKSQWRAFFDSTSKTALVGKRAEIEVASLNLGDQIEVEWLPLIGITYDPKDDILEIALEGADHHVDHLVHKPRELWVDFGLSGLANFEVIDGDGARHIVKLRDPLKLPTPAEAATTKSR